MSAIESTHEGIVAALCRIPTNIDHNYYYQSTTQTIEMQCHHSSL